MRDDVSSVSQLFDMQRAFLCKFISTALDTEQESVIKAQVYWGKENKKWIKIPTEWQIADLDKRFV